MRLNDSNSIDHKLEFFKCYENDRLHFGYFEMIFNLSNSLYLKNINDKFL